MRLILQTLGGGAVSERLQKGNVVGKARSLHVARSKAVEREHRQLRKVLRNQAYAGPDLTHRAVLLAVLRVALQHGRHLLAIWHAEEAMVLLPPPPSVPMVLKPLPKTRQGSRTQDLP